MELAFRGVGSPTRVIMALSVAVAVSIVPARFALASSSMGSISRAASTSVPDWTIAAARQLIGTATPSVSDPNPESLTVAQMAQRIYANALLSQKSYFRSWKHRSVDPLTGNILDGTGQPLSVDVAGQPTILNVAAPPHAGQAGASPLSCTPTDPTCLSYGGTTASAYLNENTCQTNPAAYDGCMAEPNNTTYENYCGPNSSRAYISNWYGAPYYNLGQNPPNSTTKGFAYLEHTIPDGQNAGTSLSNMVGPIEQDVSNHIGFVPTLTDSASGTQNTFQARVGGDVSAQEPVITSLFTRGSGFPLPEWRNYGFNVKHILTIKGYDFTYNPGSITYFDGSSQTAGTTAPGQYSTDVPHFWQDVKPNDGQIW